MRAIYQDAIVPGRKTCTVINSSLSTFVRLRMMEGKR